MAGRDGSSKSKLSKTILEMKFMKRTALREIKKENEEEQRIDAQHWVLDLPQLTEKDICWQSDPSYASLEELPFGRMSFKGFNPEVEKLMTIQNSEIELAHAAEREREIGVSDEEMAERYESLVGTIGKKFTKKRSRSAAVKDEDEDSEEDNEPSAPKIEKQSSERKEKKKKKDKKGFMIPSDD